MRAKVVSEILELHTDDLPVDLLHNLSRIYPLLIILDHCLNYFLWIGNEIPLNFINTILFIFAFRFLLLDRLIIDSLESFLVILFGIWSSYFNSISCLYYLMSIIKHIKDDEPPTMEQINYLLNSVANKLTVIRLQARSLIGTKPFQWRKIFIFILLLTPVQYLVIFKWNILDERGYMLLIVLTTIFYNSYWVQGTGLLLWRLIWVRQLYYGFHDTDVDTEKIVSLQEYINFRLKDNLKTGYTINLDLDSLGIDKNTNKNSTFISKIKAILYELNGNNDSDNKSLPVFVVIENNLSNKYQILEVTLQENERKWYPNNWRPNLLPFERKPTYVKLANDKFETCLKRNELINTIPLDWDWLEDDWNVQDWLYFDTKWNKVGSVDTKECFTRSRTVQRLIFAKLESQKIE